MKWSKAEVKRLIKLYDKRYPMKKIAKLLNRSVTSVSAKASNLHLSWDYMREDKLE